MSEHLWESALMVYPPERHVFVKDPANDFLCAVCHRPRAMHLHDGFVPVVRDTISFDPKARYGVHPHWTKPGTLKNKKDKPEKKQDFFN